MPGGVIPNHATGTQQYLNVRRSTAVKRAWFKHAGLEGSERRTRGEYTNMTGEGFADRCRGCCPPNEHTLQCATKKCRSRCAPRRGPCVGVFWCAMPEPLQYLRGADQNASFVIEPYHVAEPTSPCCHGSKELSNGCLVNPYNIKGRKRPKCNTHTPKLAMCCWRAPKCMRRSECAGIKVAVGKGCPKHPLEPRA